MTKKIVVDTLSFRDVGVRLCVHPVCDAAMPGYFVIKEVQVSDVGKKSQGVYFYELITIVVHAILVSAIKGAPAQLGGNLQGSLGTGLASALQSVDYGQVQYDVGHGLQEAGAWTGWQLGRLGNGTEYVGNMIASGVQQASHTVSSTLDQALGVQNAHDPVSQTVKNVIDQETGVLTSSASKLIRNTTDVLSTGVDEIGQNVSKIMGSMGTNIGSAIGELGNAALQKALPSQGV